MHQFDWLCDVCGYVMSLTSGIYWVELDFINNCKEPQLWLVLLRYSANVADIFPWVITWWVKGKKKKVRIEKEKVRDEKVKMQMKKWKWFLILEILKRFKCGFEEILQIK